MHILLHFAKTAFLRLTVPTVNSIPTISTLLIVGLLSNYNLVFKVHLIVVVILGCGAAILDKLKIVGFLARVLQITVYKLHEAEVDIFRTCSGLQVVELAVGGKLIKTTVHHINRVDNLRVLQQLNRARLLKVRLRHLRMTTIHSGRPKTCRLKIRT